MITGGAGFIGSHLVRKLLSGNKWNVTVVDNFDEFYSPRMKRGNIRTLLDNPSFHLFENNICDTEGLRRVFESGRFDAMVHLAARAGVRPSLEAPGKYAETNVMGTLNLLEMARKFGVGKFVFGSSSSVYGNRASGPFSESDDVSKPISPYAATKVAGEALCHTYTHLYGIRTVCLRFFTVYGPRQRPDLAIRKFTELISKGEPIPVYGDGTTKRDYTYVDDIIQGVHAAVHYENTDHEVINLGESETVELNRLIRLLEDALGQKAVIERKDTQPGDVPHTYADISRAKKLLKYDPKIKIEEGITRFVEWFKEQ